VSARASRSTRFRISFRSRNGFHHFGCGAGAHALIGVDEWPLGGDEVVLDVGALAAEQPQGAALARDPIRVRSVSVSPKAPWPTSSCSASWRSTILVSACAHRRLNHLSSTCGRVDG
jgi:hypothetical protein